MLSLLTELFVGTAVGVLFLFGVLLLLAAGKYTLDIGKLFLEEIKWLNNGIKELVVPEKTK